MSEPLSHRPRPGVQYSLDGPSRRPWAPGRAPVQLGFDEIGTPLHEATFVVVDLETTGGSPKSSAITEIGAVKVRGGEVLGQFATLVNPGVPIPAQITVLTGITTAMVVGAPPISEVFPAFVEFAGLDRDHILVAHNARFDVGFLRAAAGDLGYEWPNPKVVDTVALSRRVVTKDEAPNHKLATLAGLFGAETSPTHRALDDAQATVDVLHAVLGRLGPMGVTHVEDLASAADPVPFSRRKRAHLADGLPHGPGVYEFVGPDGAVLYVGVATNVHRRVRQYFTASEKRRRIAEMVDISVRVRAIECATLLEAQVRELRLIGELAPPYNRRSRNPSRFPWIRLTDEAHPRLSIVRRIPLSLAGQALGPFTSHSQATAALDTLHEAHRVRRCTTRLPLVPHPEASSCALLDMGRCPGPCVHQDADTSSALSRVTAALAGDLSDVKTHLDQRIRDLSAAERYEEAATQRDRLRAVVSAAHRGARLSPLLTTPEIVAARWIDVGWEISVIRYGRLAAAAVAPNGTDPMVVVGELQVAAEHVPVPTSAGDAASIEESQLVADWLWRPGTRLIHVTEGPHPLASAIDSALQIELPPLPRNHRNTALK